MKIAPRLQRSIIKAAWCGQCGDDADAPACGPTHALLAAEEKMAKSELRALLAVARAAKRAQTYDMPPWPEHKKLDRALARLERVSKEKP